MKKVFFFLFWGVVLLCSCGRQDREIAIARLKCENTPCVDSSCVFWDSKVNRCGTEKGLSLVYSRKYKKDSLEFYALLYDVLEEQERLFLNEVSMQRKMHINSLKSYLSKVNLNNKSRAEINKILLDIESDESLVDSLKYMNKFLIESTIDTIPVYKLLTNKERINPIVYHSWNIQILPPNKKKQKK